MFRQILYMRAFTLNMKKGPFVQREHLLEQERRFLLYKMDHLRITRSLLDGWGPFGAYKKSPENLNHSKVTIFKHLTDFYAFFEILFLAWGAQGGIPHSPPSQSASAVKEKWIQYTSHRYTKLKSKKAPVFSLAEEKPN